MADRKVGSMRQRDDDESRLAALKQRVKAARERVSGSDSPDGIDARAVGDDRSAVNAREVEIDDDRAAAAGRGEFGDDIPTADGSQARSRVAKARARAANKVKAKAKQQREKLQEQAEETSAKQILKTVASAAAAGGKMGQTGNRKPGATGTQDTSIAERATDAATVRAPMGGSLRTVGDERVVEAMARSGGAVGDTLLLGRPRADEPRERPGDGIGGGMALVEAGFGDASPGVGLSFDDPFGVAGGAGDETDREVEDDAAGLLVGYDGMETGNGGLL